MNLNDGGIASSAMDRVDLNKNSFVLMNPQNERKNFMASCTHRIPGRTVKATVGRAVSRYDSLLRSATVALSIGALGLTGAAFAADLYVDGTLGNDVMPCTAPGLTACRTIQAAINKATSGDTIHVAAGVYPEPALGPLTVNKRLTLLGSEAGVDARTRVGGESTVSDPQGTSVSASGVVIDGFTFQGSSVPSAGFGIWLKSGIGSTVIRNNIIQNNITGIGLANIGIQAVISRNLIRLNNLPGPKSGAGIYTDQLVGGPIVENVLITANAFIGNDEVGIDISNTDSSGGLFNMTVSNNSFVSDGRAMALFNTDNVIFENNTVPNAVLPSAAILIFDHNNNLMILGNDLKSGLGHAIRLSFLGLVGGPSAGVVINENNIGTVGPGSFVLDGLLVDPGSHIGTVNAECNWWGSPTGPTNPNNPGGAGEEVVGDADFTPWLTAPTPVGACIGGVSTPGKVTGGGQIPGEDPIFSPLGDLISLPAIVRSRAGPNSKATFGLTAKCCPASGNLDYNDHDAGVRIKAQSINNLFITSGSCGPNTHATFSGTAQVIRSTGTTSEPFTVEVDDCGDAGTADTFGIRTTTYSNGPSQLIGGNIQIHRQ